MIQTLLSVLPPEVAAEIKHLATSHADFFLSLSEIRLRTPGTSAIVLKGENILLQSQVTEKQMSDTAERLCHGSLYAYRDAMAEGYLPFGFGIRVGIVGTARYHEGQLFGISEIRGLHFRIPHEVCDTLPALLSAFSEVKTGMLLYSKPGIGKTSALKALVRALGSGKHPKRVAVIDERLEFPPMLFMGTTVDILSGYRREKGLEIAIRTLSPEIVVLDEIGGEAEAKALSCLSRSGIPLLASAHADTMEDIGRKGTLSPFLTCGVFDVFARIQRENGKYSLDVSRSAS